MIHHFALIVLITIIWPINGDADMDGHPYKTMALCEKAQASFERAQTLQELLAPFGLKERHYSECHTYMDKREEHV